MSQRECRGARRENHGHKIPEKLGGLAPNRSKDFTPSQQGKSRDMGTDMRESVVFIAKRSERA